MINKDVLAGDDYSFSGDHVKATARACAFIGVTMALSAIIGSISIFCIKYTEQGAYYGAMLIVQSILLFVSSMVLWFGRNESRDEYGF